jgi:osmotically-inducible protein OsmY
MKISRVLLLAGLPLVAALQGCIEAAVVGAAGAGVMSFEDRRTSGTQVEDEGIALRANNRIGEQFGEKVHVNVTAFNRAVLMTGEVPDAKAKADLEKLVLAVPNVRSVANEVQLAGLSSLASRSNDSFITSKVKARLLDSGKVNPIHVRVVTEASVVYLMGLLTDPEADAAVEVARTTGGVRKVVRIIELCKPTDEACRPRPKPAGS